ncbi:MAG: Dabb family protein [Clostridiales bacterium]|nr:Dabb family protein [Clostridiales bacterium]
MIKHIILWKLRDDIPECERQTCREEAKRRLEGLAGKIDGMISIKVNACPLDSSNADMMLESEFVSVHALDGYQKNPLHLEAASYVRSVVSQRLCLDFEV